MTGNVPGIARLAQLPHIDQHAEQQDTLSEACSVDLLQESVHTVILLPSSTATVVTNNYACLWHAQIPYGRLQENNWSLFCNFRGYWGVRYDL